MRASCEFPKNCNSPNYSSKELTFKVIILQRVYRLQYIIYARFDTLNHFSALFLQYTTAHYFNFETNTFLNLANFGETTAWQYWFSGLFLK